MTARRPHQCNSITRRHLYPLGFALALGAVVRLSRFPVGHLSPQNADHPRYIGDLDGGSPQMASSTLVLNASLAADRFEGVRPAVIERSPAERNGSRHLTSERGMFAASAP
jgi:hypothetical protein